MVEVKSKSSFFPKEIEKLLSYPYSMWVNLEKFFSRRKDSRKFNEKRYIPQSNILPNCREATEKRIQLTGRAKKIISSLRKLHARNLKERKKENFEFWHHIVISVKNCFCNVLFFFVSVQRRVSLFDFLILSFYFILRVKSNVML